MIRKSKSEKMKEKSPPASPDGINNRKAVTFGRVRTIERNESPGMGYDAFRDLIRGKDAIIDQLKSELLEKEKLIEAYKKNSSVYRNTRIDIERYYSDVNIALERILETLDVAAKIRVLLVHEIDERMKDSILKLKYFRTMFADKVYFSVSRGIVLHFFNHENDLVHYIPVVGNEEAVKRWCKEERISSIH